MLQLPLLMELSMPWLMISARRFLPASKADALFAFDSEVSACSQSTSQPLKTICKGSQEPEKS